MSTAFVNPFRAYKVNTPADYRPDWDVASLNECIVRWLVEDVRRLKGRDTPAVEQKIPILLSPAGYGKTHLYARISHAFGHEIFFVFLPPFEDVQQPHKHIRWHVIESLFRTLPGEKCSPLASALARLCHRSLLAYFDWLPPSVAKDCESVRQQLEDDWRMALDIVAEVKQPQPFVRLAESLSKAWPNLRGEVLKAMVLGWSSTELSTLARRWLRGEFLPESDLQRLGLGDEPPSMHDILRVVPALFQYQTPVVLCFDQIESVLVHPEIPRRIAVTLMEILQTIPVNCILNCLQDRWPSFFDKSEDSFKQRVEPQKLAPLNEDQGVEMVRRRLRDWSGERPDAAWPFDETSIRRLIHDKKPGPRGLIQLCDSEWDKWIEKGINERIYVTPNGNDGEDLGVLFLKQWNRELEAIRHDPTRTPIDTPEERLYRGVKEALCLAREGRRDLSGVRVRNVQEGSVPSTPAQTRLSVQVDATSAKTDFIAVIPVTKMDNGSRFSHYFKAVQTASAKADGVVLIHPRSEPSMGPTTKSAFDDAIRKGRLRVFALSEQTAAAECLECLLTFLDRAAAEELQLDGQTLSVKDCHDLILKTGVLDGLALYEKLVGWGIPTPSRRVPPSPPRSPQTAPSANGEEGKKERTPRVAVTSEASKSVAVAVPVQPKIETNDWAEARLVELANKLKLWGLPVEAAGVEVGPTFARLKVRPASSRTTFKKVCDKAVDLKIHLSLGEPPLIGDQAGYISVDVQCPHRQTVTLDEVLADPPAELENQPAFPVGKDVAGHTHWLNLADPSNCHLLVAGTTGSGKSEFLKAMIAALARRLGPHELQFVLIDPKQVTFNLGGCESPYLADPIACAIEEANPLIERCFTETEARYDLLRRCGRENITELQGRDARPHIVVFIDEFADLMADKEAKKTLEITLNRIGAKARAAGIHLVLATQRPEAPGVVTTKLRSNLPGRICFRVAGEGDSRIMLSATDAARLLGKGDLLWKYGGGMIRLQSPFVEKAEFTKALRLS